MAKNTHLLKYVSKYLHIFSTKYISPPIFFENICPWSTKSVISSTGIFVATAKKNIVWVKMIQFYFMTKIIRILISCSMKIFCTVNISKHNSNMHCKELHLNNFKDDFLNIWIFFAPSDSRFSNIVQTIHQWKYYLFSVQMTYKPE